MSAWAAVACFAVIALAIFACIGIPELFERRWMKREWAKYDADRAAENERFRLDPTSRPIPTGGRPSATRPRYCR